MSLSVIVDLGLSMAGMDIKCSIRDSSGLYLNQSDEWQDTIVYLPMTEVASGRYEYSRDTQIPTGIYEVSFYSGSNNDLIVRWNYRAHDGDLITISVDPKSTNDNKTECAICGFEFYTDELILDWRGAYVCYYCYDIRPRGVKWHS